MSDAVEVVAAIDSQVDFLRYALRDIPLQSPARDRVRRDISIFRYRRSLALRGINFRRMHR